MNQMPGKPVHWRFCRTGLNFGDLSEAERTHERALVGAGGEDWEGLAWWKALQNPYMRSTKATEL